MRIAKDGIGNIAFLLLVGIAFLFVNVIPALIIFALMYVGMLVFSKWRVWFAVGGAVCMVIFGVLPMTRQISSGFKVILLTILIAGAAAVLRPVDDDAAEETD